MSKIITPLRRLPNRPRSQPGQPSNLGVGQRAPEQAVGWKVFLVSSNLKNPRPQWSAGPEPFPLNPKFPEACVHGLLTRTVTYMGGEDLKFPVLRPEVSEARAKRDRCANLDQTI